MKPIRDKRIKVLQFGSPEELYGAERWILALIKHLDADVIETTVVSVRDDPELEAPLCAKAQELGFPIKVFECYGKFNYNAVRQIRRYIIENDIDIIHTHHYKTDIIGLLAVKGTTCKIVSTPHGWSREMDLKLWCYEMLDRCIFPLMDAVVPLSDDLHRSMLKIPGLRRKLRYIQNGVDIDEIMAAKEVDASVKEWKDRGGMIIGYIGQLIGRKGVDVLLDSVTKLGPLNWKLILIGEGEQREELEMKAVAKGVRDNVEFLGFRADRLSFLKGFDAFVLPSRTEGIPRCLMEAMTAGVPVVASDIPGCRSLVTNMETGILFPVNDPVKLAESIKMLAGDAALREKLKEKGRKLIEDRFSAARMAEEYTELFTDMALNRKG